MRKFTILIALALLAIAVTGYAQTPLSSVDPNYPPVPADNSVQGAQLWLTNTYGTDTARYYQDLKPCRVLDTRTSPAGFMKAGETRTFPVDTCLGTGDAVDVVLQITTIGVTNLYGLSQGWLSTTTPSSPQRGGVMAPFGGWIVPPFTYFTVGKFESGTGIAQLTTVADGFSTRKGIGLKAEYGDTHVIVDVIGMTTKRTETSSPAPQGGMNWKGVYSSSSTYVTGDVVSAPNGSWVKTSGGWELVSDGMAKQGLKTCLASSNDFASFKGCITPYVQ